MTTLGLKTLYFSQNTFTQNVAILGGAIYCDKCNWATMFDNKFYRNIAQIGGDIYVKDATNYIAASSYLDLVSHYHEGSIATSFGGSIYIHDY